MNAALKKLTALTLAIVFVFSFGTVFAEDAQTGNDESSRGELINDIIKNISVFARYDEINMDSLYITALEAIVGEDQEVYEKAQNRGRVGVHASAPAGVHIVCTPPC